MFTSTHPIAALTFDDGPMPLSNNHTSSATHILDTLKAYKLHATFFYCGNSINEDTACEVLSAYKQRHEIGNHTYHHLDLTTLSTAEIYEEYEQTRIQLTQITGLSSFLTRPPYLTCNHLVAESIPTPLIGASVDSKDWSGISSSEIIHNVLSQIHDGAIILMHENAPHTSKALPLLIPQLLQLGYNLTTVSHMMELKGNILSNGMLYHHANINP